MARPQALFVVDYVTLGTYGSGSNQKWVRTPLRCRRARRRRGVSLLVACGGRAMARPASSPRASFRAAASTIFSLSDDQDTRRTHAQDIARRPPRAARGGEGRRSLRHVGLQAFERALARARLLPRRHGAGHAGARGA